MSPSEYAPPAEVGDWVEEADVRDAILEGEQWFGSPAPVAQDDLRVVERRPMDVDAEASDPFGSGARLPWPRGAALAF